MKEKKQGHGLQRRDGGREGGKEGGMVDWRHGGEVKEMLMESLTSEDDEKLKDEKKHSRNQSRKPRGGREGGKEGEDVVLVKEDGDGSDREREEE